MKNIPKRYYVITICLLIVAGLTVASLHLFAPKTRPLEANQTKREQIKKVAASEGDSLYAQALQSLKSSDIKAGVSYLEKSKQKYKTAGDANGLLRSETLLSRIANLPPDAPASQLFVQTK